MHDHANRTKIVATIGPASSSAEVLEQLFMAGVDVFRINCSHGAHADHQLVINNIRAINKKLGLNKAILVDLQGPKLRVGEVENNGIELVENAKLILTTEKCIGTTEKVFVNYTKLPQEVTEGEHILLDDGRLVLEVEQSDLLKNIETRVVVGGILSSKKGVNLPHTKVSLPSLTEKDLEDLQFALKNDVDWIGLSFVRSEDDIKTLKEHIAKSGKHTKAIAKIEKPEALEHIDAIIAETDGLMVARGDLGVEYDMAHLPNIQKMLVRKCVKASKPVIVATQMMESMIQNYVPTRAEVNDVANAVLDGADAVMLSAETSVGKFPVKVVEWMRKIIVAAEEDDSIYDKDKEMPENTNPKTFIAKVICYNACKMAMHMDAKAIITMTHSGYTAFKLSSYRPKAGIIVFTDSPDLLGTISLLWGVRGFVYDKYLSTDETISDLKGILKEHNMVKTGDTVLNIASMPINDRGRANMIKISVIE